MGTRGVYGYRLNHQDKVTYNHFDSYPEYLGRKILDYVAGTPIDQMREAVGRISLVNGRSRVPPHLIESYREYADLRVSEQRYEDWYCLLRKAHGDLTPYHRNLRHMIDSQEFLRDSLFCEWGYIINLDNDVLELYRGFNKNPNAPGRYARLKVRDNDCYRGVALVRETPLFQISRGSIDDLVREFKSAEAIRVH